eukprot:8941066-Pyramimonas_sp.AAC.1
MVRRVNELEATRSMSSATRAGTAGTGAQTLRATSAARACSLRARRRGPQQAHGRTVLVGTAARAVE